MAHVLEMNITFQLFVQKKMKPIANGGTKLIAQGSQMSQRNALTNVTNAGQAITRVSDHPAGTSKDSDKYDSIQSFWHGFIMVVYEKFSF